MSNAKPPGITGLVTEQLKFAVTALTIAVSVCTPSVQAAVGDLDPAFGDHGREVLIPGAFGAARSIELPATGGVFVGGSSIVFSVNADGCSIVPSIFAGEPGSELLRISDIEAIRMARLADGRIVAVGRRIAGSGLSGRCFLHVHNLAVFRLEADGSLDVGFGLNGIFDWDAGEQGGTNQGWSLLPENDGSIVVAGTGSFAAGDTSEQRLVVLRLLSDGSLDSSFGDEGVVIGPLIQLYGDARIARVGSGYRVMGAGADSCIVIGIVANGSPDSSFGIDGTSSFTPPDGGPVACNSIKAQADGGLLLAGRVRNRGFVTRLLANGAADATFAPDAKIATTLATATAITTADNGHIFVAGSGLKGTAIMRLDASGQLDTAYGNSGRTWIDLPPDTPSATTVYDMALGTDGSILAAGGAQPYVLRLLGGAPPFVARLLGDAGGASGGVVSFLPETNSSATEGSNAVVKVRRSGGSDGAVSINYRTVADGAATADEDFVATEGTLHWADGDRSDRKISISIAGDNGFPESRETFHVALDDLQGDAGLGKAVATVNIQADGSPGGQIQFYDIYVYGPGVAIGDEDSSAQVWLSRDYFAAGRVCVSVATQSGTAVAGQDFTTTQATPCWEDGDSEPKVIEIPLAADGLNEGEETFTAHLANPTGGAILGPQILTTVTIRDTVAPPPPPPPPDNGGGGPADAIDLLVLAALLLRRRRQGNYRV